MKSPRILIIAQTPPPFHGQAIMQKYLVDAEWNWCRKEFVRMNFSDNIGEVGAFKFKKISQLTGLIGRIRKSKKSGFDLAYYPPAGPNRVPIYRDVILLFYLKLVSKRIILHFHAGGINQIFSKVSKPEALLIRRAFRNVDAAVVLSDWLKKEVQWCLPKQLFVVGNGINDVFPRFQQKIKQDVFSFLFIGNLKSEKGIFTLLEAALLVKNEDQKFTIKFIGSFHSKEEEQQFSGFVNDNRLTDCVRYLGPKNGDDKWGEFQQADALCLPTFETEAMPISILEAMMFQLPVITTNWRSIPDVIRHGENGLLFEPKNARQLADCMKQLMNDVQYSVRLGRQGRNDFLQTYTVEQHLRKMENVFKEVAVQ